MSARAELGTLEASGLVQVAALLPELEYVFRHALIQDAAYSSLLKQDRRDLHRLAAETLLAVYPDRRRELAGVIALHLERAGDTAAATEQLVIAGEHAAERFANREARAFFDRAEANFGPDDVRADLRLRAALGAARVNLSFGGPTPAIERLERALSLAEAAADRKLVGDAYFWVAFLRRFRGESPESSPELAHAVTRSVQIGEARGDPVARALPMAFLGMSMIFSGKVRAGAQLLEDNLDPIEANADPTSAAILAGMLTLARARIGDFAAAERAVARAERLAATGDPIARLDATIARSAIAIERGELDVGEALASQCAASSEELGALACVAWSNVLAGSAHLARDDIVGAKPPLERSHELAQVANIAHARTLAEGFLGSVQARLGDLPAGIASWNGALERARSTGDRFGEATTRWQRARTLAQQDPPDWASGLADLDAAAALFEAMEARPALARVLRDRAHTLRGLGRAADAEAADARSRALGAELGLKDFAAR